MTRAESEAARYEREHAEYLRRREEKLAYAKQYAKDHKDKLAAQQRARRWKAKHGINEPPPQKPPSTTMLEDMLPFGLRMQKSRIREEYKSIHITERPPYDYFLRCKTIEHLRNYGRE